MKPIIFLLLLICICGCKDEGTPPAGYQRTITLALVDVGTTDAWLRVRFTDAPPYGLHLVRDRQTVVTINSSPADTLVGDEVLLPRRTYTYKAYRLSGTSVTDSSEAVQVTTMDTTSSAWHWALDTLGVMNSYLLDCAIIAPDNIWVVGTIYARDSLGNVEDFPHNAARWDGTQWHLLKIAYAGYPVPITSIFAYHANDIWFVMGYLMHWNGATFREVEVPVFYGVASNKMWGSPNGELFVVGNSGTIAYSPNRGATWRRQESGTTQYLSDVFGISADNVYVSGKSPTVGRGVVLKKNGQTWQTMILSESFDTTGFLRTKLYGAIDGLWKDERGTLYTVGNLMFQYKHGRWDYMRSLAGNCLGCNPNYLHHGYLHSVRGNSSNDMIVAGERNTLRHFNGVSWAEMGPPYHPNSELDWYQVAIKGNMAVAAGSVLENFGRGVIVRLWR
jgi:hypothetical protein